MTTSIGIVRWAVGAAAALALLAFAIPAFAATITLSPSSTAAVYTPGASLVSSSVTLSSDGDDSGLITEITLADENDVPVNFDALFGAFNLSTDGQGPYPMLNSSPTILYGDLTNGYAVSSTTGQVTTLTGSISASAVPGSYILTTSVKKLEGDAVLASFESEFVIKQTQVISFGALSDKTTDDAPFSVSASASSGLPVSFDASGDCSIEGTLVTLDDSVGDCVITASQAGDDEYAAADDVAQFFSITAPIYRYVSPDGAGDGLTEDAPGSLQDILADAPAGAKIYLAAGEYDLTSIITVNESVSLIGEGDVTIKSNNDGWSTTKEGKHLVDVFADDVALENLTLDSNDQAFGVQFYKASGALNGVTIKNSKGAGLTVNGSSVTAADLNTSGNAWGAVNVDPGSGVTAPSAFTLNGGSLGEEEQIWSDGANVNGIATVTVNAPGYSKYHFAADAPAFYKWRNHALAGAASIANGDITTVYETIAAAVAVAQNGDTVQVAAGDYAENITFATAGVTLKGPNAGVNPNTDTRTAEAAITGQVNVYASDVTIDGFTITNPAWNGATVKGVYVYGGNAGSAVQNVAVNNNIFEAIRNAAAEKGAYGLMIQGNVAQVGVVANKFNDITSEGWAHAIEVTPTGGHTVVPQDVSILGNLITNVANTAHNDEYGFTVDWVEAAPTYADPAEITFTGNTLLGVKVRSLKPDGQLDVSKNYWGSETGPAAGQIVGAGTTVVYTSWYTNEGQTVLAMGQAEAIDLSIGTDAVVTIPADTIITGDEDWEGDINDVISSIEALSVNGLDSIEISGFENIVPVAAIKVGVSGHSFTLSNAATLVFTGQAGKLVGWTIEDDGDDFTVISACTTDQVATQGASLAAGADCYTTIGADLVVYTKHFTTFVAYTADAVEEGSGTSSGGGGSSSGSRPSSQSVVTAPVGQVLGAAVYNFTADLTIGSRGADVTALQQILIDAGLLKIDAPTGYFGTMTQAALAAWQAAHGVAPAAGYFGPITRAALAAASTPAPQLDAATIETIKAKIADLLAQVAEIQAKLAAL